MTVLKDENVADVRYLYFNVFRKVLPRKLRGFQEKKIKIWVK